MARRLSLDDLRRARRGRLADIEALPHVIGTGLGVKRRAGAVIARTALIVYVDRKRPEQALARSARIPRYILHRGHRVPIDVVAIGPARLEFGRPPFFLSDGSTSGVVTAFARSGPDYFLLGSAHCLGGDDGNIFTPATISVWDESGGGNVSVAESLMGVRLPGLGVAGDFGYLDAGVATIVGPEMMALARRARPMRLYPAATIGLALEAKGPNGPLSGTIEAVEVVVQGMRTDIVIRIESSGTYRGHSGMLWRTRKGLAVAMHGYGADYSAAGPSRTSLATALRRVAHYLDVDLLDPAAPL